MHLRHDIRWHDRQTREPASPASSASQALRRIVDQLAFDGTSDLDRPREAIYPARHDVVSLSELVAMPMPRASNFGFLWLGASRTIWGELRTCYRKRPGCTEP